MMMSVFLFQIDIKYSGWSPVQGVLQTVCKIQNFRINSEWVQARQPNPTRSKKKKKKKKKKMKKKKMMMMMMMMMMMLELSDKFRKTWY
jgi:hypothetical protein